MRSYTYMIGIYRHESKNSVGVYGRDGQPTGGGVTLKPIKDYVAKLIDIKPHPSIKELECRSRRIDKLIIAAEEELTKKVKDLLMQGEKITAPEDNNFMEMDRLDKIEDTEPVCVAAITIPVPDMIERVNVTLPRGILMLIDDYCKCHNDLSRSQFFADAALNYIKNTTVRRLIALREEKKIRVMENIQRLYGLKPTPEEEQRLADADRRY